MKKFTGDIENTPLCDILKALGYSYIDSMFCKPSLGKKDIYPSKLNKKGIMHSKEIVFTGNASEVNDWLIETKQIDSKKELTYSVL